MKQLLREVVRRLPVWPPSMVMAQALNRLIYAIYAK